MELNVFLCLKIKLNDPTFINEINRIEKCIYKVQE